MLQLIFLILFVCLISERKMTQPTQHHHIRRSDGFFFMCLPAALTMTHHHLHLSIPLLPHFFNSTFTQTATQDHRSIIAFFCSIIVILFLIFIITCSISHNSKDSTAEFVFFRKSNNHPHAYHKLMITTVYAHMKLYLQSIPYNI